MVFSRHLLALLALTSVPLLRAQTSTPVFGSVTAIGGSASDIALDESRGLLYIANFGAASIDVMSTASGSIQTSFPVEPFPGSLALSFDSQYLVIAHYCNTVPTLPTTPPCANALTSIHLADNSQQVFALPTPALGVAFLANGQALIVATDRFLLFNPASGNIQLLSTLTNVAQTLPVAWASYPGQVLQASLTSSADGSTVWGIGSAGTSGQLLFQYTAANNFISASLATTSPLLLPRISSSADGTYAMAGYTLLGTQSGGVYFKGRYPPIIASTNITGSAIDSVHGIIYAQFPDTNQPTGPGGSSTGQSAMLILDSDNLTFRDRISIPEDMVGKAILNAAGTVLYAVSESGVMTLPVGSLNSAHRIASTQEDVLVATNFCNRGVLTQNLTITDPGGGNTDFEISSSQTGVTVLPSSGTTPATVQVLVDPTVIPGTGGTNAFTLTLHSRTAVNQPKPVRLLVNNPDPSQRGTIVDQPGILSDILADAARNRVYVLRQDMNQLLVFDGSSLKLLATLRTSTSPTMMAMTADGNELLVGHDDSQLITVYDLNALQPLTPVVAPGGHYVRSIAVSNSSILALARNETANGPGTIDSVNLAAGTAAPLTTLGIFKNTVSGTAVLAASPTGANILLASPDGTVALYTAAANTFVNSRKDLSSLSGAFAASDYGYYVVGNSLFNASLVPVGVVNSAALPSSGFTFLSQGGGYLASAQSAASAGDMLQITSFQNGSGTLNPLPVVEAPLLPITPTSPIFAGGFGSYGSGSNSGHAVTSFTRTVAPMVASGNIVALSTSGLTLMASSYQTSAPPQIAAIVSAADGTASVAPGELVSIYGQNLSQVTLGASGTPLSTSLGDSCIGVNGLPIPLIYTSSQQINAQLPFNLAGSATLTIHSPGGLSNNFHFTVQPAAPSVFLSGSAGPETGLATIIRDDNGQLVTPTNPLHPKDQITIYLTGLGQTTPAIAAGQAAPSNPLSIAAIQPSITLGGSPMAVTYAGLAPGEVGVYQINATVPTGVASSLAVPLVINQNGAATTLSVRVVTP